MSLWRGRIRLGLLFVERRIARLLGARSIYNRHLAALVRGISLFDANHYLEANPDVAAMGVDPLLHYVAYGDREGRFPLPIFDPSYYRQHARGRLKNINALLHYSLIGRHLGISPSPWFDVAYYLAHNKDVARAGVDPLVHYLRWGGAEGRSPCASFDGAYYLQSHPDVTQAGVNPLIHYLDFGRLEGRAIQPPLLAESGMGSGAPLPVAAAPNDEEWAIAAARRATSEAVVDVIVPVYKGRPETLRCLLSVLKSTGRTAFELLVINDSSPDPDLVADLRGLAARGLFTLLENDRNRGFVYTVNRGMRLHADRDVVLLNSDAEVYGDWLDRLCEASRKHEHAGTVTPLSNNATICSYPRFLHDNPYPVETSYASLDALAAEVNAGVAVETPTAVGFCMLIRRECLQDVGWFDEEAFGKGYGEENDFCQRAIGAGWRNIVAADVFVRHWGSASFQGERAKRVQAALRVLDKRYPNYQQEVKRFIEEDALADARRRLDWARLKQQVHPQNVLIVCHSRGGGAERHVQEDTRQLLSSGFGVFYLRPQHGLPSHARLGHPVCNALPNLEKFRLDDTASLAAALGELGITRIHVHGLVDFAYDAPRHLIGLVQSLGVPLWIDIHDYKVICPRINLTDYSGRYCGEPLEASRCNTCLATQGNDFGARDILEWREMHRRVLRLAEKIFVPDQDVSVRLGRYYPELECLITPHEEIDAGKLTIRKPVLALGEPLRIVVIGAISKIKGYDVLLACARDAQKRGLPIEFSLLGYSLDDQPLERAGVRVTGRYLEHEAEDKLLALSPHAVWLPSLWPETYSYTLSLALKAGYPVFAFDIGAIARRLREAGLEELLAPLESNSSPQAVNDHFLRVLAKNDSIPQAPGADGPWVVRSVNG